jgi:DNA-binding transcriptional LysR family regulator
VDLRQLAAIVAVADQGSFSLAADALHTVQSNVSNHVARLEKELGVQLVDRHRGQLTEEGRAVVDRARRIAAEVEAMIADVAALGNDVAGSVRLGCFGTTARWLVPRLLERLALAHPRVHLTVVDATSATAEPQLASGRLDLAVVNLPVPGPDVVGRALFDEDLVLVVPAEHALATEAHVDMADLDRVPLLLPAHGTAFRSDIDKAAADAGITLVAKADLDGVRLIASLTFDGFGPAILPATAVPGEIQGRWRPISVAGLPRRRVGIAARRRGLPSAPARAVLTVLDEIVASEVDSHRGLHRPEPS